MRVTFDTNVFDKVIRPTVYPKDPDFQDMVVIHEAVKDARVQAFISDTTTNAGRNRERRPGNGVWEHRSAQLDRSDLRRHLHDHDEDRATRPQAHSSETS